tara:strand:- start:2052 stop:3263 length:1212 start_codon:yes stop_codon:yes gene_type:complete
MKILFFCTHCNQGTGYGKSAAKMCNWILKHGPEDLEFVYYAFQNYPNQDIKDRFIDPRIRFVDALTLDSESPKGFGDNGIIPTFDAEKPNMLFIYNDLPVCISILDILGADRISPIKVATFLDVVYPWQDVQKFSRLNAMVDHTFVYTDSWKTHLVQDLGWNSDTIDFIHLGVDEPKSTQSQEDALDMLGLPTDSWVVLNMNRNSYRKQWCVTVKAWIDFWVRVGKPERVKLFVGGVVVSNDGYDILELIRVECMKHGLDYDEIVNKHVFQNPWPLHASDAYVETVMAASAVGLNTCCGEGYGMTNMEHAFFGKPQVVSGVPSVKEVMGDVAIVIEPALWYTVSKCESHGGEIGLHDYKLYSDALVKLYTHGFSDGQRYIDHVRKVGNWDLNLKPLHKILDML